MSPPLAPIVLFVYNRPAHTRKTLEALAANPEAADSVLYVFADGPRPGAAAEVVARVDEARRVVRERAWCGTVHLVEEAANLGLAASVTRGVTEVIARHDRAIVLEDDLVTSPGFLGFMNQALERFAPAREVYGVSGYCYPHVRPLPEVYLLPIACSWGWATWRRGWEAYEPRAEDLVQRIAAGGAARRFDFGGYPFLAMLRQQARGEVDSWGIRFYASMFLRAGCFAFPGRSLVRNIGMDHSGTHTGPDAFFEERPLADAISFPARVDRTQSRGAVGSVSAAFRRQYRPRRVSAIGRRAVERARRVLRRWTAS